VVVEAARLCDIGEISVPERSSASVRLSRRGASQHARTGALRQPPVPKWHAIASRHERFDGAGYRGLAGERMPPAARIVAAACAFNAMVVERLPTTSRHRPRRLRRCGARSSIRESSLR
jgi:hypothetical protein